jgi:peptidyl-prolyl cis-trans isomerase D
LKLITDQIQITDQEISAFFEKNKENYKTEQQRKGDVVLFRSEDFKKEIVIPELEIANYYLKNKDNFREEGKIKIARIFLKFTPDTREQVSKEIDKVQAELRKVAPDKRIAAFSRKAKEISQDDKAKEGGDYGYTGWKNFTSFEKKTIRKISPGEISNVVGTDKGFSILCVTQKIPPRTKPLDDVKKLISETLLSEKLKKHIKRKADEFYKLIKDKTNLAKAAKDMNYKVTQVDFTNNRAGIKDVDMTGRIATEFFNLTKNEISKPVDFYLGTAVIQLKDIKEPLLQELNMVKDKIKKQLEDRKKTEILKEKSKSIFTQLSKLKNEDEVDSFLKKRKLTMKNNKITHGNQFLSYSNSPGFDKLIFNIDTPLDVFLAPIAMDKDFVIIKIESRELVGREDFKKQKTEFYKKKIENLKNEYFSAIIFQKQSKAKFSFNKKLYDEIVEYQLSRFN